MWKFFFIDMIQYTTDVYYNLLVRKLNGDKNLTSAERVFIATVSCNNHIINENIIDSCANITNKMVYNSCKINKVYEKKNVKGS